MDLVFVLNHDLSPLMPCRPAKARHLLRDGRAEVVKRRPFTIRLKWKCESNLQTVTVGIDKGSHHTGYCAVANGEVLLTGTIEHRRDIKEKMEARREHRRSRRNRKWYRPARFDNRASMRATGRLAPSIKANADEVVRTIRKLPLPISQIIVEDVLVDIARINDPTLQRADYQKSNRLHPNLRLACLIRDSFLCRLCHKKNGNLEAHHIIHRSAGGKDTIENLATLCGSCHDKLHDGKVELNLSGENGFKDRIAQRTMQGKTYMYDSLRQIAPVSLVFGYQTYEYRHILRLPKDHHIDALCVATLLDGEIVAPREDRRIDVSFLSRQTRRQFHSCPQKGKGRVRYQVNEELDGFTKGDIVRVRGKWEKRIWSIYSSGSLAFPRVKGEPSTSVPKKCKLLEKAKTLMFQKPQLCKQ